MTFYLQIIEQDRYREIMLLALGIMSAIDSWCKVEDSFEIDLNESTHYLRALLVSRVSVYVNEYYARGYNKFKISAWDFCKVDGRSILEYRHANFNILTSKYELVVMNKNE